MLPHKINVCFYFGLWSLRYLSSIRILEFLQILLKIPKSGKRKLDWYSFARTVTGWKRATKFYSNIKCTFLTNCVISLKVWNINACIERKKCLSVFHSWCYLLVEERGGFLTVYRFYQNISVIMQLGGLGQLCGTFTTTDNGSLHQWQNS